MISIILAMKPIRYNKCKAITIFFLLWMGLHLLSGANPCQSSETEARRPKSFVVGYVIDSFSGVSLEDTKLAVKLIFETRFKNKYPHYSGSVILFPDMHSAVEAIKRKEIHSLGAMTLDYLITKEENNLRPVRNAKLGDSAMTQFVILVRKSHTGSLEALRNKEILIESGGHGSVAAIWLDTLLLERSLPESKLFFQSTDRVDKGSLAVLKLFFGTADACIIQMNTFNVMKELNPQIGADLRVLLTSPEFLMGIFGVVKGIDKNTEAFILKFVDELSMDEQGVQLLTMFRVKQISEFKPESMNSIETLYQKYMTLKAASR